MRGRHREGGEHGWPPDSGETPRRRPHSIAFVTLTHAETPEARRERRRQHAVEYQAKKDADFDAGVLMVLRWATWTAVFVLVIFSWAIVNMAVGISEFPSQG